MSRQFLNSASLRTRLEELAALGSPVDLSAASTELPSERVQIELVGGACESQIVELKDGRVGCILDLVVTNKTARTLHVVDVALEANWVKVPWEWLQPREMRWQGKKKRTSSYYLYKFPGRNGSEWQYEDVINHELIQSGRLPGRRPLKGVLLGVGGRMPSNFHHGQMVDLTLTITASDGNQYAAPVQLWTERLQPARNNQSVAADEAKSIMKAVSGVSSRQSSVG